MPGSSPISGWPIPLDSDPLGDAAGEIIRDLVDAIEAPSVAYTPALVGITLGNGTLACRKKQLGKLWFFEFVLTLGTTTTFAAGANGFALPAAARSMRWRFNGEIFDNGLANYPIQARMSPASSTTNVELVYRTTAGLADSLVTNTAPISVGNLDVITVTGMFEAA